MNFIILYIYFFYKNYIIFLSVMVFKKKKGLEYEIKIWDLYMYCEIWSF